MTVEHPAEWIVREGERGISLMEPTGFGEGYGETAYRGELTAIVTIEFEDGSTGWSKADYDPFLLRGVANRMREYQAMDGEPGLYRRTYDIGNTHGDEFVYFHPDKIIVTIDAVAPAADMDRRSTLEKVLRTIELRGGGFKGLEKG